MHIVSVLNQPLLVISAALRRGLRAVYGFFETILLTLGIFLGPLFGAQPSEIVELSVYLERFIVFILAIICWVAFERSVIFYIDPPDALKGSKKSPKLTLLLSSLSVLASALAAIGVLHAFKVRHDHFVFLLLMGYIGARITRNISQYIRSFDTFYLAHFFEHTILGALSFFAIIQKPTWQPIVVGLGFSLSMVAVSLSKNLAQGTKVFYESPKTWSAMFGISFLGGPLAWTSLAVLGQLPKFYAAVFVIPLLFIALPQKFKEEVSTPTDEPSDSSARLYERVITAEILMILITAILLLI